jgi:hypothetical protein
MSDARQEPLLQQQQQQQLHAADSASARPLVLAGGPRAAAAAVDPLIDDAGFGPFQWKVCILVGAIVYMPAGWIMLPVFVNPQLSRLQPEVFTERRCVACSSRGIRQCQLAGRACCPHGRRWL